MNYQDCYSIRGWNPDKKTWLNFIKQMSTELFARLKQAISPSWITEKIYYFNLERAGSKKIYTIIRKSIDNTLRAVDMIDIFKNENEIVLRMQIRKPLKLLLFKGKNDRHITAEFIIENVSSMITTYQLTFINNEGTLGDLLEAVKYEQSKTAFNSSRLSSGNFPQITFKIIADLLKINIQPKNVRLLSASFENKQL